MEINSNPKKEGDLYKKGQVLIEAAYEYWQEFQKTNESSAVVWLKDSGGHMVLFTRGEYSRIIMSNVDSISNDEPLVKPFED